MNATSDIAEFLGHGREGLIVNGTTAEAFAAALDEAARLDSVTFARLRDGAKQRARQSFDYRNYRTEIADLVERAQRRIVHPTSKLRLPPAAGTDSNPIRSVRSHRGGPTKEREHDDQLKYLR